MKKCKIQFQKMHEGAAKKWRLSYLMYLCCALLAFSCTKADTDLEAETLAATLVKVKAETLESQLKKVKKAAMRFHSFEQARKAGYAVDLPFNPSPYIPNMGFHYTNVQLLDGSFDMEQPEILLYVPNEQGKLKLVAVEYAVPVALSPTPPEGFLGSDDHWEFNPNVAGGAWTLHAWVVLENPDGVFTSFNPDVPVADPSQN